MSVSVSVSVSLRERGRNSAPFTGSVLFPLLFVIVTLVFIRRHQEDIYKNITVFLRCELLRAVDSWILFKNAG